MPNSVQPSSAVIEPGVTRSCARSQNRATDHRSIHALRQSVGTSPSERFAERCTRTPISSTAASTSSYGRTCPPSAPRTGPGQRARWPKARQGPPRDADLPPPMWAAFDGLALAMPPGLRTSTNNGSIAALTAGHPSLKQLEMPATELPPALNIRARWAVAHPSVTTSSISSCLHRRFIGLPRPTSVNSSSVVNDPGITRAAAYRRIQDSVGALSRAPVRRSGTTRAALLTGLVATLPTRLRYSHRAGRSSAHSGLHPGTAPRLLAARPSV